MDEINFSLVAAGNTYNPALITLLAKGYCLRAETLGDDRNLWSASKAGRQFAGYSPPELLGLVALWEHLGDDWNRQEPDILAELLDAED
jgi:hypothetical protein